MSCAAGSPILAAIGLLTLSSLGVSGQQPGSSPTFTDIAEMAGLTVPSIYGGLQQKRFIIETNGAGVAWVDVDHDGWLDALVLGGTRLAEGARGEDPRIAAAGPTTRLYRNSGRGTFTVPLSRSDLPAGTVGFSPGPLLGGS